MSFHDVSSECRSWINSQPCVKEESLTDWLLYTFSAKSNKIFCKTFTRNEEAHTEADWEWWFSTNVKAYRFLVQAKKLRPNADNYPLSHYGNKNGLQIDLLIESAIRRCAMPLYAYYSNPEPQFPEQVKNFNFIDA